MTLPPETEFTQFADPCFEIDGEDMKMVGTNTGAFIRLDCKGWLDVESATKLRDWLDALIPKQPAPETVPIACGHDIGFNFKCRRERGHVGPHSWDPKRIYGEEPL